MRRIEVSHGEGNLSPKQRWLRHGDVQYVRVEIRPPRKLAAGDLRHTAVLEWTPAGSSDAYEAFHALIDAVLRAQTLEHRVELYTALEARMRRCPADLLREKAKNP